MANHERPRTFTDVSRELLDMNFKPAAMTLFSNPLETAERILKSAKCDNHARPQVSLAGPELDYKPGNN